MDSIRFTFREGTWAAAKKDTHCPLPSGASLSFCGTIATFVLHYYMPDPEVEHYGLEFIRLVSAHQYGTYFCFIKRLVGDGKSSSFERSPQVERWNRALKTSRSYEL